MGQKLGSKCRVRGRGGLSRWTAGPGRGGRTRTTGWRPGAGSRSGEGSRPSEVLPEPKAGGQAGVVGRGGGEGGQGQLPDRSRDAGQEARPRPAGSRAGPDRPGGSTVIGPIRAGAARASPAFLARPNQTSPAVRYIRQVATSVASKRSVLKPAARKARGSLMPSCSESRIAAWPPHR